MKHTFLTLVILLTFVCGAIAVPQQAQSQDSLQELIDSSAVNGVDAFSDTTAVDTGTQVSQSQTTYQRSIQIDDIDDLDDVFGLFSWGTGLMMILTLLALLIPFLLFLVPIILIVLVLFLLLRRRKSQPQPDGLNQNVNNTQTIDNMPTNKKLCRSNNRVLGGVCAGLGEYFDIDPTVVRIAYLLLTVFTAFSGIIIYIILLLLMPQREN